MATAARTVVYRMELVQIIAERLGIPEEGVDDIIMAFLDEVAARLSEGDQVVLRGFGVFEARQMKPVVRRRPDTGEEVAVEAKRRPVFRASQPFKDRVNANGS
jgi:nucleoid DNA-binding protein